MSSASLECAGAGGCMGVRNSSSSHVSGPPLGYRGSSGALEGKRCSLGLGGWDFSSLAAAMKSGRPRCKKPGPPSAPAVSTDAPEHGFECGGLGLSVS